MTLTNDVEWLLNILENNLAAFLEARHLHLDYLSDAPLVVSEVLDALIVLDDARDAEVEAAEDDSLLDVLDESEDVGVDVEGADVRDVSVDEAVPDALAGVTQDLVVQLSQALVYFATFAHVVDYVLAEYVHLAHLLVDLWQVLYVLGSVLDHGRGQRSLLPELGVDLHQVVDLVLLRVVLAEVLLQEVVEANVYVPVVILLEEVSD